VLVIFVIRTVLICILKYLNVATFPKDMLTHSLVLRTSENLGTIDASSCLSNAFCCHLL